MNDKSAMVNMKDERLMKSKIAFFYFALLSYFYGMTKPLSTVLFILSVLFCSAQDTSPCYFDDNLSLTSKSKAAYTGELQKNDDNWEAKAFYPDGKMLMHGFYKDKKLIKKQGRYDLYFPNGQKKASAFFNDNMIDSVFTSWHISGNKSDSGFIRENLKTGLWKTWYSSGLKESEGYYVEGVPDSIWHWYRSNGQPATIEVYKNSKLNDISCFDTLGNNTGSNCRIELKPRPAGSVSFEDYVMQYLLYPKAALKKKLEGTVTFNFRI
ncbi:MAG TPA: hypothetical protein VFV68_16740, partial [Agriterribacter sp.]|nr:hypothetical protein [Agriterribacter sp.]